jgi:Ataxin-2 C-terminal region
LFSWLDLWNPKLPYSEINALLAEVAGIKEEKAADDRVKEERKEGLSELNRVLDLLRIVGKGTGAVVQDSDALFPEMETRDVDMTASQQAIDGEMEEGEEREVDPTSQVTSKTQSSSQLNPMAPEFQPRASTSSTMRNRVLRGEYNSSTPGAGSPLAGSPAPFSTEPRGDEDVEMGEIQPEPIVRAPEPALNPVDELEEGEASDNSTLTSLEDE